MRTRRIIATAVAAGVVGAGAVVTPVVLAADDGGSTTEEDGTTLPYGPPWADEDGDDGDRAWGMHGRGGWGGGRSGPGGGFGPQRGMGPGQAGSMRGDCLLDEDGLASGTLDGAEEKVLLGQVEHEKVARDVYVAFFEATGDYRFDRVAQSEGRHLEALRMLLDRYDLTDPTAGLDDGEFASKAFAEEYQAYVAQGTDLAGALAAAQQIETQDIADLTAAAEELEDAPDVERVYQQQARASEQHLAVFSR